MRISKGLGRRGAVRAIVAFFALSRAIAWQQDTPLPTQRLDPLIQKIVSEVSQERIADILKKLESFETRNTLSDPSQANRGIGAARQWIFDQFKSYSPRLEVSFDTHMIPKRGRVWKEVELRNVVAILPGKMPQARERWILVGGHYDSLNLRVPQELRGDPAKAAELPAPGVTDDGSRNRLCNGVRAGVESIRIRRDARFHCFRRRGTGTGRRSGAGPAAEGEEPGSSSTS